MSTETPPRIAVNFNEIVGHGLVLLAKEDRVMSADGAEVRLEDGLAVIAFEYNHYGDGSTEYLYVRGAAERNDPVVNGEWTRNAKWCCRFDGSVQSLDSAP